MLNEEKIRLMARLAVYEKEAGAGDGRIARFFQNDYVFAELLHSFVAGTLAWCVCAALVCGYHFEELFFSIYEGTTGPVLRFAAMSYVGFMGVFLAATFLVYTCRSRQFVRRRRLYAEDLDALLAIYEKERAEALGEEAG